MTVETTVPLSLRQFRHRIAARLPRNRHQIIFALDGIPGKLADAIWHIPTIERWQAVFPTTSTTCWLSSLTGLSVSEHGIPGVVFQDKCVQETLINICQYQGDKLAIPGESIFHDARRSGYLPQAIMGDLLPIEGAWTRALLQGAEFTDPTAFFTLTPPLNPKAQLETVETAVERALARSATPCLIWVFIDVDHYIHTHGYDSLVTTFLQGIDELAQHLTHQGYDVIAHSDHGLVPVVHDEEMARLIAVLCDQFGATMGGAGLTRWFYVAKENIPAFQNALITAFSDVADIVPGTELAEVGHRAGDLFLIARGERFIAPIGWCYEHGSRQADELDVFYAVWEAQC
ncbi:alkaline phosphatase family protein [Dickeya poaceiphila]|nr:alkaline phosphatase family protein [Dickeya poaceiphila]